MATTKVCRSSRSGAGPARPGGLMTVIAYFISGILCIFQNQMECHFFFPREMGNVTVLVSHSNHILHGKRDEWDWELPGEKGVGRKGKGSFFVSPLPANLAPHRCLPHPLVLEATVPGTTRQSAVDWGYVSFLTPVWSTYHTGIKPQDHRIHPAVSKKQHRT